MENWIDIPGYEGYYKIKEDGTVRSYDRKVNCAINGSGTRILPGRQMRPYRGHDGYLYFLLTVNKVSRHIAQHRLLALTFLPNPENKREVNHINADKTDNRLANLEWVTPKQNIQHSIKLGNNTQCLPGENNPAAKLTATQVLEIRASEGKHGVIAARYNVCRETVSQIKRKERWAHV